MFPKLAVLFLAAACLPAAPQYPPANAEWNRPIEPFRIVGNLYYVGPADVSVYLFATPQGLILIDSGFRESAPVVEANLKKLGFRIEDIRLLLACHGHNDHVGATAEIKARSGARLLVNPVEAPLFSRGGLGDFAFKDAVPYPPVEPDGALREGQPVKFGGMTLTPHFTPGHTKGGTSWTATVREGQRDYRVVIVCSLSAPGYRLVGNPQYPNIVADFQSSIDKLRALPCDIFLGQHSWDFGLHQKIQARVSDPSRNPFEDPQGYRRFLDKAEAAIKQQEGNERLRDRIEPIASAIPARVGVVVFVSDSKSDAARNEEVIARVARAAWGR